MTVVEFGDFECPYCRSFARQLRIAEARYGDRLRIIYVHFPLSFHRFAQPAAVAAECAATENRFAKMHDVLFAKQDSLGLKTWQSFAADAGMTNLMGFEACLKNPSSLKSIEQGLRLGRSLGIKGTPAVLVNGWMYTQGLDSVRLFRAIDDALAGRKPNE